MVGHPAIHYLHQTLDAEELVALYLTADIMLVTPLRDGMNLAAKEYVTWRTDATGVLILSEFAGAAAELCDAVSVNPHDLERDQGRRAVCRGRQPRRREGAYGPTPPGGEAA